MEEAIKSHGNILVHTRAAGGTESTTEEADQDSGPVESTDYSSFQAASFSSEFAKPVFSVVVDEVKPQSAKPQSEKPQSMSRPAELDDLTQDSNFNSIHSTPYAVKKRPRIFNYNSRIFWSIFIIFIQLETGMNTLPNLYKLLYFNLTMSPLYVVKLKMTKNSEPLMQCILLN